MGKKTWLSMHPPAPPARPFAQYAYQREITQSTGIRHMQFSHNAPYLPPNISHNLVFHFSCVLQSSQEKLKTMLRQNSGGGGGGGANKVHYGRCASGVWQPKWNSRFLARNYVATRTL